MLIFLFSQRGQTEENSIPHHAAKIGKLFRSRSLGLAQRCWPGMSSALASDI
jgi:hypothetical protein